MSKQEQNQVMQEMFEKEMSVVFTRRDSRHLSSAAAPEKESRRLRSAFDVFDFVNNAISSGVKEAKHTQNKELSKALGDAGKFLGPVAKDVSKVIHDNQKEINEVGKIVDQVVKEVDQAIKDIKDDNKSSEEVEVEPTPAPEQAPVEPVEEEQTTPVVEMAAAPKVDFVNACGKNEALNLLGSNKCTEDVECDGTRTCSAYGWCQGESGCEPKAEKEPKAEEVVEEVEVEEIEEEEEESIFDIEEREMMKTLADMGRVFDDEDEERLAKLTEDLTA